MNNFFKTVFLLLVNVLVLVPSCKKPEEKELVKVTTVPVSHITRTSGYLEGSFINEGTDTIISYGFCWNTEPQPTFDDNRIVVNQMKTGNTTNGTYLNRIKGLSPNTTYYVKAYAITVKSKIFGEQESFTTKPATVNITFNPDLTYQSISDIDGNIYKTIKIDDQEWMAENLKTTRFNDGSAIPLVTEDDMWIRQNTPGYCWYYNNEAVFKNIYGGYYNWYAVSAGKLCPSGWHVPSEDEWNKLKLFLGMTPDQLEEGSELFPNTTAGNKIKETGTVNWVEENTDATNESGFTALPGGWRNSSASFDGEGEAGGWWSAAVLTPYHVILANWVADFTASIFRSHGLTENTGQNVRCVKD
jgi:uncharacterized protein (TIGR02145 family)